MKGTIMSLTKRALPEDIDVTDPRDTFSTPDSNEPSPSDWAVAEISNQISTLEKLGAVGYVSELKEYRARLQAVIETTVKPF